MSRPPRISRRRSMAASRKLERRTSTSRRWSSHSRRHSARLSTFGTLPPASTFTFIGMRLSSSVSLNSDSIRMIGSTVLRARLQHDADVLGRFVAHVGEQRQLLLLQQLGDLLDQARLRHRIGDLGDDDLPVAAAEILLGPARAHAERAAAGAVGLGHGGRRVDDDAAGRQIRPRHELHQLLGGGARACAIRCSAASQSSAALCGGIEVAMPTAMPCEPLASRFGKAAGSTTGSSLAWS